MNNLNLYQGLGGNPENKRKMSIIDSEFFWSIGLLVFVLIVLGVTRLILNVFENKKILLEDRIATESATFGGSDLNRIVDFQVRVNESNKNIKNKTDMFKVFSDIESSMTKGSAAVSLLYSDERKTPSVVETEMLAGDFSVVARQILGFKENNSFKDVFVQEISRSEEGIKFKIFADFK